MSRQGENTQKKEKGWGKQLKDERLRDIEQAKIVIKTDFNDPFKYKPTYKPKPSTTPSTTTPSTTTPSTTPSTTTPSTTTQSSDLSPLPSEPIPSSQSAPTQGYNPTIMTPEQVRDAAWLYAALVEVFEHTGPRKSKSLGTRGAAIMRSTTHEDGFVVLLYNTITRKHDFYFDIPISFGFNILPDLFAACKDVNTGRTYSFLFQSVDNLSAFARQLVLVKDFRQTLSVKNGGVRRMLVQDLVFGDQKQGDKIVQMGDSVKLKYDVYHISEKHPEGIGSLVVHKEMKRFEVGDSVLPQPLTQGILRMRKKGTRCITLPPGFVDPSYFSSTLAPDATVVCVITITSLKKKEEVKSGVKRPGTPITHVRVDGGGADLSLIDSSDTLMGAGYLPPTTIPASSSMSSSLGSSSATPSLASAAPTPAPAPPPATSSSALPSAASSAGFPPAGPPSGPAPAATSTPLPPASSTVTTSAYTPTGFFPTGGAPVTVPSTLFQYSAGVPASEPATIVSTPAPLAASTSGGVGDSATASAHQAALAALPVKDVAEFLRELQLESFIPKFQQEGVHLTDLFTIEPEDLKQLVPLMGPRARVAKKAAMLKEIYDKAFLDASSPPPAAIAAVSTYTPTPVPTYTPSPIKQINPLAAAAAARVTQKTRGEDKEQETSLRSLDDDSLFGDSPLTTAAPTSSVASSEALENEYKRGQQEALEKAREQIDKIKAQARAKFAEMEASLAAAREAKEESQTKAKAAVAKLNAEIQTLKGERDELKKALTKAKLEQESAAEKTRQYVIQVRESKKNSKVQTATVVKDLMGKVHNKVKSSLDPNTLYDGKTVTTQIRAIIKQITEAYLEQAATEGEE